jgi:hypothetical protein
MFSLLGVYILIKLFRCGGALKNLLSFCSVSILPYVVGAQYITLMCRIIVPYEGKSDKIIVTTSKIQIQCHMKSGVLSPVYVRYCMIL